MKKKLFLVLLLFSALTSFCQQKPKQKQPSQKEMKAMMKEMEEAMKDISPEEKEAMEQAMKGLMTTSAKTPESITASFNDNKSLVPKRDAQRIARIPQQPLKSADVAANATILFNKLQVKMQPAQKTIVTNVLAKEKTADGMMSAAITALLQGQSQAAMALALKAVQSSPKNPALQSNLAAILSQSGYPDKAIPYLKKLTTEFPANGTVLHNLGFAWLQLGEVDTAQKFFGAAAIRNPNNPETNICQGVIHELQGDPQKAIEAYKEAFELSPNGMIIDLMKNGGAENEWQKVNFEKLKSRITIHEYFPKNWIQLPKFVDDVAYYSSNASIQESYDQMLDTLVATLTQMNEGAGQDLAALADKDMKTFVNTLMAETQKGINVMSKIAAYIDKILEGYIAEWHRRYLQESMELKLKIDEVRKQMTAMKPGEKCQATDRKRNAFMEHINPIVRKFHAQKIEEFRVWLNAYCTWVPYVVGNPKNGALVRCLSWVTLFAGMHTSAIDDQQVESPTCKPPSDVVAIPVALPEIPSIHCKSPVKMPLGLKDIQLTAESINLDANQWGIKQSTTSPMPNLRLSFGVSKGVIGEPGKFGCPFAKAGGGVLSFSGHSARGDELTPLPNVKDELAPLSKILDELMPLDPTLLRNEKRAKLQDMQAKADAEITRKLLEQLTSRNCDAKPKYITKIGPVSLVEWNAAKGKWVEVPETGSKDEDPYILSVGFVEFVDDGPTKSPSKEAAITSVELIEVVDAPTTKASMQQMVQQQVTNTIKSGLQAVISNGLDVVSRAANSSRNLFD